MLTKIALTTFALVVLANTANAWTDSADADNSPWGENSKEWECPMPRPTKADGDKDPVYKTEIFITYGDTRSGIATFNVRHTRMSGGISNRPDQYTITGTRNNRARNDMSGVQSWTGFLTTNPNQRIVGEIKWVADPQGSGVPTRGVYTEKVYKDQQLVYTAVARCNWTGPGC